MGRDLQVSCGLSDLAGFGELVLWLGTQWVPGECMSDECWFTLLPDGGVGAWFALWACLSLNTSWGFRDA